MSAANRGAVRRDKGFYETPASAVDCLVDYLCTELHVDARAYLSAITILEPMAGRGAIMRRLIQLGAREERIHAVEVDTDRAGHIRREFPLAHTRNASFFGLPFFKLVNDLVITNPDFACSLKTAQKAIRARTDHGIAALLLPLDFMAGVARAEFHRANPSTVLVLPRRPSFCVSVKCVEPQSAKLGCGWRDTLDHDVAAKVRACQKCGGKLRKSQTDAQSYAWFIWGLSDKPRWVVAEEPDFATGFATREEAQAACDRENKRMRRGRKKAAIEDAIDF